MDSLFQLPDQDTPEKQLLEKETGKELIDAIHLLETNCQQVVLLRIFHDMSFKEIGIVLGKSENWARVTFYRSKQQLQKSYGRKE
jgi:RNA polymerase sigma-70 factor (ECF subfamily)